MQCELHYDASIRDLKPRLAHRLAAAVLEQTCERLIGETKTPSGISSEVYQCLLKRPGEFLSMEAIAGQLVMMSRNIRRCLGAGKTSFADILDDVRSSLAIEYLKTAKMSTDDIALLLGFSEPTNFRRALKQWIGRTPKEYRTR